MDKVTIIGGGLAGLICAIDLNHKGIPNRVIERKAYPFHRVCGEYVSREAVNYLESIEAYPGKFSPPQIQRFQLSSINGNSVILPLEQGGFGISRFSFDDFLYQLAKEKGTEFYLNTTVREVMFNRENFKVMCNGDRQFHSAVVVGAFGKRSNLDRDLNRGFFSKKSPYMAVKYHIKYDFPDDLIAIHNFSGGYCGISQVEEGRVNLCYLSRVENLRKYGSINKLEAENLCRNPFIKKIFNDAEFIFKEPKVINEISFESKEPVYKHIIMAGDAAGMITPLCGNGMAMAINAGKFASELIAKYLMEKEYTRNKLEMDYSKAWNRSFGKRMRFGRNFQKLFGGYNQSNLAVTIAKNLKPLALWMIRQTHGDPF